MAKSGLASPTSSSPGADYLQTPAHSVHAEKGDRNPGAPGFAQKVPVPFFSAGWEVAAPERTASDGAQPTPQQATYSATAADFFDVVFVTVALVAYSADACTSEPAPRTTTHRATTSRASFQIRSADRVRETRQAVASNSIRFTRPAAETSTTAEPLTLSSLSASTPQDRPALDSRMSALDSQHPTGPPTLPHISIRGWTSRYA